jgi:hypothetical protein
MAWRVSLPAAPAPVQRRPGPRAAALAGESRLPYGRRALGGDVRRRRRSSSLDAAVLLPGVPCGDLSKTVAGYRSARSLCSFAA